MAARYTGPNEGVYQTNPRHMIVKRPRNIDDDDLSRDPVSVGLAPDHPTVMSYFLLRLRLAEISRNMVDRSSLSASVLSGNRYDYVLEADNELDNFIREMPSIFHLDHVRDSVGQPEACSLSASTIAIQRYFINSLAYTQRCRLHLPYLARGSTDTAQAYSRGLCLAAARLIIQTELDLEKEDIPFVQMRLKLTGTLYGIFIANITLLMNLCLRRSANSQQEIREGDFAQAVRLLEAAARDSPIAADLLQSLMQILRKYSIDLPRSDLPYQINQQPQALQHLTDQYRSEEARSETSLTSGDPRSYEVTENNTTPMDLSVPGETAVIDGAEISAGIQGKVDLTSYFEELVQNWGVRPGLDDQVWNSMLSELDASFF